MPRSQVCKNHERLLSPEENSDLINFSETDFRKYSAVTSRNLMKRLMSHIDRNSFKIHSSVLSECHRVYYIIKVVRNYTALYNERYFDVCYIGKHKNDLSRPFLHLKQAVGKSKNVGIQVKLIRSWLMQSKSNEIAILSIPLCSENLSFAVEDLLIDEYQTNPNSGRKTIEIDVEVKMIAAALSDKTARARHRSNDYDYIVNYEGLKTRTESMLLPLLK